MQFAEINSPNGTIRFYLFIFYLSTARAGYTPGHQTRFFCSIIRNLVQGRFFTFWNGVFKWLCRLTFIITLSFLCQNSSSLFLRCAVLPRFGAPESCGIFFCQTIRTGMNLLCNLARARTRRIQSKQARTES